MDEETRISARGRWLVVKNWDRFQHYSDRNVPWIKLYTNVFDDFKFSLLSESAKLLAFCVWVLAGKGVTSGRGAVPHDIVWIRRKCNLGKGIREIHIAELIESGFLLSSESIDELKQQSSAIKKKREKKNNKHSEMEIKRDEVVQKLKKEKPVADLSPIFNLWEDKLCSIGVPPLTESLTKTSANRLSVLSRNKVWMAQLPELLDAIAASAWHCGKNDKGFIVSAPWLVKEDKTADILFRHRQSGSKKKSRSEDYHEDISAEISMGEEAKKLKEIMNAQNGSAVSNLF